jgi:hypothetical protein
MEATVASNSSTKLPPLKHLSQAAIPTQHKLDALIKDISNKQQGTNHLEQKISKKEREFTSQSSKILLKSVNNLSRGNVKVKGENNQTANLNKFVPLASKTSVFGQKEPQNV